MLRVSGVRGGIGSLGSWSVVSLLRWVSRVFKVLGRVGDVGFQRVSLFMRRFSSVRILSMAAEWPDLLGRRFFEPPIAACEPQAPLRPLERRCLRS